ncbi:MAG: FKBP-type peptidyl-prolyl cis-trans isomerase [Thermoprotei archaeon]
MLADKDFALIEYTVIDKEANQVLDTTDEKLAKEKGLYREGETYGPVLYVVGENRWVKGFEEGVKQMSEGEEREFEVPPEKAYGQRDPAKVKVYSLNELRRRGITPYVGQVLETADGGRGVVRSISGGRVTVDFNHPLAGKTLVYKVKVVKVLRDNESKLRALIERWFGRKTAESIKFSFANEKEVVIELPKEILLADNLQLRKLMLTRDYVNFVDADAKLVFKETFSRELFSQSPQ